MATSPSSVGMEREERQSDTNPRNLDSSSDPGLICSGPGSRESKEDNHGDGAVVTGAPITYIDSSPGGPCLEEHQVDNRESPSIVGKVSGGPYILQLYFQS